MNGSHVSQGMGLRIVTLNGLFYGFMLGVLGWTYGIGLVSMGDLDLLPFLLLICFPVCISWTTYFLLREYGIHRWWHLSSLTLMTALVVPLLTQPWNPRHVFVAKFNSLQAGATEAEVRKTMAGYIEVGEATRDGYIPFAQEGKGIDYLLHYRWQDPTGQFSADSASVYLRKGRVVATEFSPD